MRFNLLFLFLLSGCPNGPPKPTCQAPFIGDPMLAPEAVMIWTDGASMSLQDVVPEQMMPLEPPPQGGYVMYVAARARNLNGCVQFAGRLRDLDTGDEVGFDGRSATLTAGANGWGYPPIATNSNVSNVNGCPDYTQKDVHGQRYHLEMVVTDKDNRTVTVTQTVTPTCNLANPTVQKDCVCTCSANYVLGKCNFFDADAGM